MEEEEIFSKKTGKGRKHKRVNNCINCGKIISKRAIRCMSCNQAGKFVSEETKNKLKGEKNGFWKGEKVKYRALHSWLRRAKPKPKLCEGCNKEKKLCVANISGVYNRDITNYKWLCFSCHNTQDKIGLNFHKRLQPNIYRAERRCK